MKAGKLFTARRVSDYLFERSSLIQALILAVDNSSRKKNADRLIINDFAEPFVLYCELMAYIKSNF